MVAFAGDMNGHIGSSNVGYDGTHGGFGYSSRNADGSRILEFADGLNLVMCNTLFTKQEAKLVTYVAGPVKSTVDYIMVREDDKAKVRNVKVISSEECVPKHKLLVMDMLFKATKTWHRKFEPRVRVWKLKEEKPISYGPIHSLHSSVSPCTPSTKSLIPLSSTITFLVAPFIQFNSVISCLSLTICLAIRKISF